MGGSIDFIITFAGMFCLHWETLSRGVYELMCKCYSLQICTNRPCAGSWPFRVCRSGYLIKQKLSYHCILLHNLQYHRIIAPRHRRYFYRVAQGNGCHNGMASRYTQFFDQGLILNFFAQVHPAGAQTAVRSSQHKIRGCQRAVCIEVSCAACAKNKYRAGGIVIHIKFRVFQNAAVPFCVIAGIVVHAVEDVFFALIRYAFKKILIADDDVFPDLFIAAVRGKGAFFYQGLDKVKRYGPVLKIADGPAV